MSLATDNLNFHKMLCHLTLGSSYDVWCTSKVFQKPNFSQRKIVPLKTSPECRVASAWTYLKTENRLPWNIDCRIKMWQLPTIYVGNNKKIITKQDRNFGINFKKVSKLRGDRLYVPLIFHYKCRLGCRVYERCKSI